MILFKEYFKIHTIEYHANQGIVFPKKSSYCAKIVLIKHLLIKNLLITILSLWRYSTVNSQGWKIQTVPQEFKEFKLYTSVISILVVDFYGYHSFSLKKIAE